MSEVFNRYTDTVGNEHWSDTDTGHHEYHYDHTDCIGAMPSAQPMRKKGEWIIRRINGSAKCSNCGFTFYDVYDVDNYDNYCRHCGAKMEGIQNETN